MARALADVEQGILELNQKERAGFLRAAQFYEAQVPGLGQRFFNEIESWP
jgi:hypothetical protein